MALCHYDEQQTPCEHTGACIAGNGSCASHCNSVLVHLALLQACYVVWDALLCVFWYSCIWLSRMTVLNALAVLANKLDLHAFMDHPPPLSPSRQMLWSPATACGLTPGASTALFTVLFRWHCCLWGSCLQCQPLSWPLVILSDWNCWHSLLGR